MGSSHLHVDADYQINQADHEMFRFYNSLRTPAPYDEGGTDSPSNSRYIRPPS
jgi:hypothetical protein